MALPKVRYALQWESKNLFALSTAIQDWLTSSNWFGFQAASTLLFKQRCMYIFDANIAVICFRNFIGADEARGDVDRLAWSCNCICMANCITCSN